MGLVKFKNKEINVMFILVGIYWNLTLNIGIQNFE